MPARSRAAFLLVVSVLLLTLGGLTGTTLAEPTVGQSESAAAHAPNVTLSETEQTFHLDVQPNGDVRWTVTMSIALAPNTSSGNFSEIATAYENGELSLLSTRPYQFASRTVSDDTGREMEITDVSRDSSVTNDTGTLELAFTWTNFGYQQSNELRIDDVFNGSTGSWFSSLGENQTLVVTVPTGYDISTAPGASIQDQTLRWEGPYIFSIDTPRIIYVTPQTPTPSTTLTTTMTNSTSPSGPNNSGGNLFVPILIVLLGGALAVIAYAATRTDGPLLPSPDDSDEDTGGAVAETDDSGGPPPATGPESEPPAETENSPADEATAAAAGAEATAAADEADGDEAAEEDEDDEIDEELLSDEERVERLIEANGGRMKQANIVTETGWSNAKVSQLLSAMAEEGRIEKLRIGRENLISFPDDEDGQ